VQVNPVARILTETDVYLKYGLHQKALEHVLKILETDPENPDALERVRDIRDALGDRPGAAEAAGRTVTALLERGDEQRIAHATERLRQLDPSHAALVPPARAAPAADEIPLPDDEPPAALEETAKEEAAGEEPVPDAPAPEEPVLVVPPDEEGPKAVTGPEGPAPVQDDESPAAIGAYPAAVLVEENEHPPLEVEIEEAEVEEAEVGVEQAVPAPLTPPPLPERTWGPLDAELEEVEFYERQGLLEEALLAIREIAAAHPGHPVAAQVLERIEGLEALEASRSEAPVDDETGASPAGPPASPGKDGYGSTGTTGIFDLGAELSAELGPELTPTPTGEFQYSVADVFEQFKRGLEKTVRPDDSATKYDLGIAFQEMGMLDEALEQFRSALAGGDRRRDAEILNMIGVCLVLKGRHGEAIDAYRQALRSEFVTEDAAKALHFELGTAHEAQGDPEVALWYFQKIARGDPTYRGVAERVSRLGGGPGTAPATGEPNAVEPGPAGRKARKR